MVGGWAKTLCVEHEWRATEIWACQQLLAAQLGDERATCAWRKSSPPSPHIGNSRSARPWAAGPPSKPRTVCSTIPNTNLKRFLAAHRYATLQRIAGRDPILLAEDTTQFDFSTHQRHGSSRRRGAARVFGTFRLGHDRRGRSLGSAWLPYLDSAPR